MSCYQIDPNFSIYLLKSFLSPSAPSCPNGRYFSFRVSIFFVFFSLVLSFLLILWHRSINDFAFLCIFISHHSALQSRGRTNCWNPCYFSFRVSTFFVFSLVLSFLLERLMAPLRQWHLRSFAFSLSTTMAGRRASVSSSHWMLKSHNTLFPFLVTPSSLYSCHLFILSKLSSPHDSQWILPWYHALSCIIAGPASSIRSRYGWQSLSFLHNRHRWMSSFISTMCHAVCS